MMNKPELVEKISFAGFTKKDAAIALNAAIEAITEELANGGSVQLVGFGTFGVKVREARQGRNPATGEPVQVGRTTSPYFKAGRTLKQRVNGEK